MISISGTLSFVDKENFGRLEHFYSKNGYQLSFSEDKKSGKIKKNL